MVACIDFCWRDVVGVVERINFNFEIIRDWVSWLVGLGGWCLMELEVGDFVRLKVPSRLHIESCGLDYMWTGMYVDEVWVNWIDTSLTNLKVVWVLSLEYLVGSGWILKHVGSFWKLVPSYTETKYSTTRFPIIVSDLNLNLDISHIRLQVSGNCLTQCINPLKTSLNPNVCANNHSHVLTSRLGSAIPNEHYSLIHKQ